MLFKSQTAPSDWILDLHTQHPFWAPTLPWMDHDFEDVFFGPSSPTRGRYIYLFFFPERLSSSPLLAQFMKAHQRFERSDQGIYGLRLEILHTESERVKVAFPASRRVCLAFQSIKAIFLLRFVIFGRHFLLFWDQVLRSTSLISFLPHLVTSIPHLDSHVVYYHSKQK